jgi:hypothetical protein
MKHFREKFHDSLADGSFVKELTEDLASDILDKVLKDGDSNTIE